MVKKVVNKCIKSANNLRRSNYLGNGLKIVRGVSMSRLFKNRRVAVFALLSFVIVSFNGLGLVNNAYALGLGTPNADSFIGERLVVRIPLLNVQNSDQLVVSLGPNVSASSTTVLSVSVDRSSAQPSVLIRSVSLMTEPYINFTLNLTDGQSSFVKEFTVLLNLAPGVGNASASLSSSGSANIDRSQRLGSNQILTEPIDNSFNNSINNRDRAGNFNGSRATGSVLGPFDFAQSNNIPEKFGAVLDGQSLWRVARRINGAMGVSINQMMLGLYKRNPEAFSSESVDSLKAGVFLDIPSFAQVNELSDGEAKLVLDRLSSGAPSPVAERSAGSESDSLPFQLTAIDEIVESSTGVVSSISDQDDQGNSSVNDEKTQEIISSLAKTVGNLTQELIRKDNQIKFLTAKVEALEAYANIDGDTLVGINSGSISEELSQLADGGSLSADGSIESTADGTIESTADGSIESTADGSLSVESSLAAAGSDFAVDESLSADEFSLPEGSLPSDGPLELPADGSLSPEDVLSPEDFQALEDSVSDDGASTSNVDSLLDDIENPGAQESVVSDQVETAPEVSINDNVSSAVKETSSNFLSMLGQWWKWLASGAGLLLLGLLAFIFRDRFAELRRSLNLFGSNDSVEFSEPIIKGGLTTYRANDANASQDNYSAMKSRVWEPAKSAADENNASDTAEDSETPVEPLEFEPYATTEENSELTGDDEDLTVEEATEYAEYESANQGAEEDVEFATTDSDLDTEDVIDFVAKPGSEIELIESDQQDLGFAERFESLLKQKDFDFARELLDFARHNEIDEQHYHCERLVLLHAMKDEEGFYDYYYEIESKVTEFDQDIQTKISKLVVELAQ